MLRSLDQASSIVAFDGDDTMWLCSPAQKSWEHACERQGIERLLNPPLEAAFRRHINGAGYSEDTIMRALFASAADLGGMSADWTRRAEKVPNLLRELKLELASGLELALQTVRDAGHRLWIITKGDLLRQAMKLAAFPLDTAFENIEIVQRKNVATYARVLAAQGCHPSTLTMIGDRFFEDIAPPIWLGARAIHVSRGRTAVARSFERLLPTRRIEGCCSLAEIPDSIPFRPRYKSTEDA